MADLLPALPVALTRAIKSPTALTTKDVSQQLRTQGRPLSAVNHADVLDKHQDYLDGLNNDLLATMKYVSTLRDAVNSLTVTVVTPGGPASPNVYLAYTLSGLGLTY